MTARDKFTGIEAEFWDCRDAEHLTHTDPIEAISDLVESHLDGRPTEEVIREMGAITCEAYRREKITDELIAEAAEIALEQARERLEEEVGDPDGDQAMFTVDTLAKHRVTFETAVRMLAAEARVWQCSVTHSVLLSPDETIELLRADRPEWFEASPDTVPVPAAAEAQA